MKTLVIYYKNEKYGRPLKCPEIISLSEEIMQFEMKKWQNLADTSDNAIMFDDSYEADLWRYALEFRNIWATRMDKFSESMLYQHKQAMLKYPEYFV
jgi:hypothetical protein